MLVRNLILNKTSVPLLNKVLNVTSLRHRAVTNNISNVNTVNYKRKDVDFSSYLKAAVVPPAVIGTRTDSRHMAVGNPDPLAADLSPGAVVMNTGLIVFREGLEAIVEHILKAREQALMGKGILAER